MTLRQRRVFQLAITTAGLSLSATVFAIAVQSQALRPDPAKGAPVRPSMQASSPASPAPLGKSSPGSPAASEAESPHGGARSMLDEPANPAQIELSGDRLSIHATNASLSEVIRQVASDTGMQVEGNSHDQRVFGAYGPGSPPEVLSALLYDSGYNVVMVGSTPDGAPRRLVLSTRSAAAAASAGVAPVRNGDDEDDDSSQQDAPPPPQSSNPGIQAAPPSVPGQPKTPQQMLEELQRMHQGQQPQEVPKDVSPN